MLNLLDEVRKKAVIGFVGGSNLEKITEQLSVDGRNGMIWWLGSSNCAYEFTKPSTISTMHLRKTA